MTESITRKTLFRWTGWFALANAALFSLISLRYFGGGVPADTALAWVYLVTVYIGHHAMLTAVPLFLLATPLILLLPRRRALTAAAVVLLALMIALTMLDSLLWSQSRFHLNALTLKILGWQSWVFAGVIFAIGLVFESLLARSVWSFVLARKRRRGVLAGTLCGLAVIVSQGIHAWADAAYYVPVTSLGQMLPVYKGATAKSFMTRTGLVNMQASRERELARRMAQDLDSGEGRLLDYPLKPLQCSAAPPFNLLFIIADSLRGDVVTPELAPNITRFAAEHATDFRNHFSGGNSSRIGMFSLFYGLPPGYWSSFSSLQQPPVLIDELQARDYQLGLFTSATMYRPVVLDRTVFARVPDLRIVTEPESDPAWKRDRKLTGEWFEWLERADPGRPFFGFLFYDATMGRNYPPNQVLPAELRQGPAGDDEQAAEFAKYQTAVHFVDGLIGGVLDDLQARGLLDSTVVLISSDHGEEFGESGEKLEKHGSGYTRYQLLTPLVLHWPGRPGGAVIDYRTSHYDIAPTLLQELFGCSNPASDYSVGDSLFDGKSWDWMVAGSYYNYAVLEPDQVTITFPNGLYEVRDWDYRLLREPSFRGSVLEAVSEQNSRFYRD
jgi:membrane-anchored protein YejM (alkaline phosphatase superfamily)